MCLFSPYGPNHLQLKFYTIMQDSKRVLGFNCDRRIEQINFFNLLGNVKNLVLSNGCEHVRNVIQWDLNSFFFPKTHKNRPAAGGFAPKPSIATAGRGLRPQTPICKTFECTSSLTHVS